MSAQVIELTTASFDQEIGTGVTLVDFWAPWCPPCRAQAPILEGVAGRIAGRAKVAKVNVDEHADLAERFGIRSIPTLIVFRDGQPVTQFVGVQTEQTLASALEAAAAARQ